VKKLIKFVTRDEVGVGAVVGGVVSGEGINDLRGRLARETAKVIRVDAYGGAAEEVAKPAVVEGWAAGGGEGREWVVGR